MWNSTRNYFRHLAEGSENGNMSSLLSPLLDMAGKIYGSGITALRSLYEREMLPRKKLPFPVISVGNLTWGGTGKTPLVEYLARKISDWRRTPLILTRGYGQDEVEQMKRHLPRAVIGVGSNRSEVAESLRLQHPIDVAILDDGLQHWKIRRDAEIITVNAVNPFGNEKLLPRGILREPLCTLAKGSVIVISHANLVSAEVLKQLKERIRKFAPEPPIIEGCLEPLFFYRAKKHLRLAIERLQNHRVTTFSAIGSPRTFQMLLSRCGIKTVRNFEFGDHHPFSPQELEEIKRVSDSASADEIVTTEKDYYRSPEVIAGTLDPLILATHLRIFSGEEILNAQLAQLLGVARQ